MSQLDVLVVVQRYGRDIRGGAEQAARAVAERLAARGHHVEVLTTTAESYVDWSGDLPRAEVVGGVRVHRLPVSPLRDRATFDHLNHQLVLAQVPVAPRLEHEWTLAQGPSVPELEAWLDGNARRFDVAIFFTYLYATTTVGLPAAARHVPTVLVPCAHDELPLQLRAFDQVARLADAFFYLTPEEGQLVGERFRPRSPQHVVGLGTELAAEADPVDVKRFRTERGLGDDPYLLYVGRIDPSKGTSWLVDRFIELDPVLPPDLRLVLLGQPVVPVPEHPRLVVITDADDTERDAAMAGAVALVHPSPHESFGMVVTEAWAQGTPVIAFGGNDVLRGHIERSGGGLVVTDRATLGAAATLLTEDDEARASLGAAGRAHVRREHGWETVIDRWERALEETAAAPAAPAPRLAPARPLPPTRSEPPAPAEPPEGTPTETREDLPPRWLAVPLLAALGLLTGFCIAGVGAAMAGWFLPEVVVPATLVLAAPLVWGALRALPRWTSTRSAHAAAVAALAVVAVFTVDNLADHGQHLATDRDPGVYLTTAEHLRDEGDLLVQGPTGPFVDAAGISANGPGFSPEREDTTLEPQFPHLTATVLAAAGWVHELGMFLATPVVGGFALLCLYGFATLLAGPRWAVVATGVAGASMPVLLFARDTYSEPIAMALLFGGLWALGVAERSRAWPTWLLAGLLLGATCMARVDGFMNLAPVALALGLHLRLRRGPDPRATRLSVAAAAVGAVVTALLGFWDTAWLTGSYYEESLGPRLPAMAGAAVAAAAVGLLAAPLLWRRSRPEGAAADRQPTRLLRTGLWCGAVGVVAFVAWGYWIRPDAGSLPEIAVEGMDVLGFLPVAKTLSVHWLTWYLSPFGVAAGVLGLAVALVAIGREARPPTAVLAGLAAVLATTLLYLWTPSVTPDHPWAMRRFAAVAIPGLAVGVAVLGHRLWALRARLRPTDGRRRPGALAARVGAGAAAVAVGTGSFVGTAAITWPVRDVRAQVPMRERVHQICDIAGDDAAILVPIDGILALMLSVPLGVWCDVPSAGGTPGLDPGQVARLALEWEQQGRRLVVVSSSATPLMNELLPTGIVAETIVTAPVFPQAVERTIVRRPERVATDDRLGKGPDGEVTFHLYPIDVDAARSYLRGDGARTPSAPWAS